MEESNYYIHILTGNVTKICNHMTAALHINSGIKLLD